MATLKPSRQGQNRPKRPLYRKRWSTLSPKQKLLREHSLAVLSEARKSKKSLSKLAAQHTISPKTVLNHTNAFRKKGRRWTAKKFDRIPRVMKINERGREVSIEVNDSRTASLIGRYHNAVKQFLNTGDRKKLRKFKNKKVKDAKGKHHVLETNPTSIIQVNEAIEEPEFYQIYEV